MKFLIILFILTFTSNCFTQVKDSIIYKLEKISLTKEIKTNKFTVIANETYKDLKFVNHIGKFIQVLDKDNQVFYVSLDGTRAENVKDYFFTCGNVQNLILSVRDKKSYFEVFEVLEEESSKSQARKIIEISKEDADSVYFINGQTLFKFNSNFNNNSVIINPKTIILFKNGKYFSQENPKLKFDSIDFSNYQHSLKTKKNNLYGILGIVKPKYKNIEKFKYYLAEAKKRRGKSIYIDIYGNEYK